jgi:hypothetical protein
MAMQMPGAPMGDPMMDPEMEGPPPEMMGGPGPMMGEPMAEEMPPAPEALDPDAAAMQIAEILGGMVADQMRKKQALEGIAQAAIMAVMGQEQETLDMPAGVEMAPDDEAMMAEAEMAQEGLGMQGPAPHQMEGAPPPMEAGY